MRISENVKVFRTKERTGMAISGEGKLGTDFVFICGLWL